MPTFEEAAKPRSQDSLNNNVSQITTIRHTLALASGLAAGALRLESLDGFIFFVVITILTSIMLYFFMGNAKMYFLSPFKSLFFDAVLPSFPGYVLAWSVVYSLVET